MPAAKVATQRESANKALTASCLCSTVVKRIITFLIYKQGKESGRVTESLLVTHWNIVHSTKVHIFRDWKTEEHERIICQKLHQRLKKNT